MVKESKTTPEVVEGAVGGSAAAVASGNGAVAAVAPAKPARRQSAEEMGKRQRSIAVSEFFYKNRHLLGFDNPRKALLTTVKEAVDNALDAAEEAGILPDIEVRIEMLSEERYRVTVTDNGPGIVSKHVAPVFAKLLYGSKFHRLKMSRGQQGIGISAAGMYAMMTTGKSVRVTTRTNPRKPAYYCELQIDTKINEPVTLLEREENEFPHPHGTRVSMELQAKYQSGRASVDEYLEQTALANPHAQFQYYPPVGNPVLFPRGSDQLPPEAKEIKPHPYGVELGTLLKMLQDSAQPTLLKFLTEEFCELNTRRGRELIAEAGLKDSTSPREISSAKADPLYKAIQKTAYFQLTDQVLGILKKAEIPAEIIAKLKALPEKEFSNEKAFLKSLEKALDEAEFRKYRGKLVRNSRPDLLPNPPTDCLAPIGAQQILKGLLKGIKAEFYTAETREPAVYRGMPFQMEVGLAYGGELRKAEPVAVELKPAKAPKGGKGLKLEPVKIAQTKVEPVSTRLVRFANRVPLLYQQSACVTFKAAVEEVEWNRYGLDQSKGSLPSEPLVVFVHMASVWVPFTSESKEAIADYDVIRDELRLALQECARKLRSYLKKKERVESEGDRRSRFLRYIGEVVDAVRKINKLDEEGTEKLREDLLAIANKKTQRADVKFDDEGKAIKAAEEDEDIDANTIVVGAEPAAAEPGSDASAAPATVSVNATAGGSADNAPFDAPPQDEG